LDYWNSLNDPCPYFQLIFCSGAFSFRQTKKGYCLVVLPPIVTADLGQGDPAHLKKMVYSRFENIAV